MLILLYSTNGCPRLCWEGRFKSQALLDETARLSCMAYVDLNPIRAGIAKNLSNSDFTSIKERIAQFKSSQRQQKDCHTPSQPRSLLPFAAISDTNTLLFSYADYFELVDWSGRHVDPKKSGYIDEREPKLLAILAIDNDDWLTAVKEFRRQYGSFAGSVHQLRNYAHQHGRSWCKGVSLH